MHVVGKTHQNFDVTFIHLEEHTSRPTVFFDSDDEIGRVVYGRLFSLRDKDLLEIFSQVVRKRTAPGDGNRLQLIDTLGRG